MYKIINNRAMCSFLIMKETDYYRVVRKLQDVSVLVLATTIISVQKYCRGMARGHTTGVSLFMMIAPLTSTHSPSFTLWVLLLVRKSRIQPTI
jgi:hypothetical protein